MTNKVFNFFYECAQREGVNSERFNSGMWIWCSLTPRQHDKMIKLAIMQGMKPEPADEAEKSKLGWNNHLTLTGGIRLKVD